MAYFNDNRSNRASEDKVITYFESEVEPGVLQSSILTNIQSSKLSHNMDRI